MKKSIVLAVFVAAVAVACRREVPDLTKVCESYAGDDFDVLSVAVKEALGR